MIDLKIQSTFLKKFGQNQILDILKVELENKIFKKLVKKAAKKLPTFIVLFNFFF